MGMCCNTNSTKVQVQQQTHGSSLLRALSFPLQLSTHQQNGKHELSIYDENREGEMGIHSGWYLFTVLVVYKQITVLFTQKEMFIQLCKLGYSATCIGSRALLAFIKQSRIKHNSWSQIKRLPINKTPLSFVGCYICLPAIFPQWVFWLRYWSLLLTAKCLFQSLHCCFTSFLLALCLTSVTSVVLSRVYPYRQTYLYNCGLWADKSNWGTQENLKLTIDASMSL